MERNSNNGTPAPVLNIAGNQAKKSLILIELESLVKQCLTSMTNQMYARNIKFAYKMKWEKGEALIDNGAGHKTRDYYSLSLYLVDKNKTLEGEIVTLYVNYYPVRPGDTQNKLLELAYKELLLNGIQSLTNVLYANYLEQIQTDAVKVEDITAKDIEAADALEVLKETTKSKLITE